MAYQLEDDEDFVGGGQLSSVTDLPPDYSQGEPYNATVPSEYDDARPAIEQAQATAGQAGVLAAEAEVMTEEEQDRVAGLIAQKRQQIALGLAPGELPAEHYAARLSDAGRQQFAQAFDKLGQRVTATGPRPGHGPTKQYTDTMLGGRRRPVTDPFGNPVYDQVVTEEPMSGAGMHGPLPEPWAQQVPTGTRRVVSQGAQRFERDPGLLEEQKRATQMQHAAQVNTARTNVGLLQDAYDQQVRLDQQIAGREQRRMDRIDAQRAQVDKAFSTVRKATQDMLDSAEIDPDKGWAEKGVGAKILAILGSAMMGFAGMDGMAHINAVIQNSIDAQKANQDRARARVAAAQGMQQSAENSWTALRAQLGDEATADEAFRLRSLLAIGAKAEAILADAQVHELTAAQAKFMADLKQQIAEAELRLKLTAEANTPTITRSAPRYTGAQADLLKAEAKSGLGMAEKGFEGAVGTVSDRQKQTREIGAREADAAADREFKERDLAIKERRNELGADKGSDENARAIAANTAKARRVKRLANDLLELVRENGGDIPGVGWHVPFIGTATHQATPAARRYRKLKDELNQYNIVDLTGAVSGEKQDAIIESLSSDSEEEQIQGLVDVIGAMDSYIDTFEAVDPARSKRMREHTGEGLDGFGAGRVNVPPGRSSYVNEDVDDEDEDE